MFRGGTCLHKLHADNAYRYSEDLDYVRRTGGGIRELTQALTAIGIRLGLGVTTRIGQYPKVFLRAPFESGSGGMRIKIEVNTFERSPARDLERITSSVESAWFTGTANVVTFSTAELVSTKLRALFQRSKGRDLFDLWLALTQLGVEPEELVRCFGSYRPKGYTARRAEHNLRAKLDDVIFREDLVPLVAEWPDDYDIDVAADLLVREVIGRL